MTYIINFFSINFVSQLAIVLEKFFLECAKYLKTNFLRVLMSYILLRYYLFNSFNIYSKKAGSDEIILYR